MDDQLRQPAAWPFPPPIPPRRAPMPAPTSSHPPPPPPEMSPEEMKKEKLLAHVAALEAALIRCLPYGELRSLDNSELIKYSLHVYHINVEKFARDFMEAAKRLHLYFVKLQKEDEHTKEQLLQKKIATMEEELKKKDDLIQKHSELMQIWREEVKEMLRVH